MRKLFFFTSAAVVMLVFGSCSKRAENLGRKAPDQHTVPKDFARQVAQTFDPAFFQKHTPAAPANVPINNKIISDVELTDKTGETALYVFNLEKGYVIVSADLHLRPVMAYIEHGVFSKEQLPEGMQDWINTTLEHVELVRAGRYDNGKEGTIAWSRYVSRANIKAPDKIQQVLSEGDPCTDPVAVVRTPVQVNTMIYSSYVVGPLLPVTWGQGYTYNDLLANNACTQTFNGRVPTGCVATAMAQVIRYHQYPARYNYAAMPVAQGNNAVQLLMKDAGTSVNMTYACAGSSASSTSIGPALKNSFGYSSATYGAYNYLTVRNNIDMYHEVVILTGADQAHNTAHAWVADGITENTYTDCDNGTSSTFLSFHFNWGWHEWPGGTDHNGWFAFDNWNVPGTDANGNPITLNFSYSAAMVTDIHP